MASGPFSLASTCSHARAAAAIIDWCWRADVNQESPISRGCGRIYANLYEDRRYR